MMSTQGGPRGRERLEREGPRGPRPAPRGPDDGENFGGNGQPGLHQSLLPRTMRKRGGVPGADAPEAGAGWAGEDGPQESQKVTSGVPLATFAGRRVA
jgi:hypothetical protein